MAAIYLNLVEGAELPSEQARHLQACPACRRLRERMEVGLRSELPEAEQAKLAEAAARAAVSPVGSRRPAVIRISNRIRELRPQLARRWVIVTLAAAIVIAVVSPHPRSSTHRAAYGDVILAPVARQPTWSHGPNAYLVADDPVAVDAYLKRIDGARAALDALKRALKADPYARPPIISDVMHAWTDVFRPLRDLGRYHEAVQEIQAAIEYTRHNPTAEYVHTWHWVYLNDLGNAHAAFGDYNAAQQAYLESIRLRKAPINVHPNPIQAITDLARSLTPLYQSMGWLAVVEKGTTGLEEAYGWHAEADAALRRYFAAACDLHGISLPAGTTAWTAYQAAPPEFRAPRESYYAGEWDAAKARHSGLAPTATHVMLLRAHLYHEARLKRVEGRYEEAMALLTRAASMPYYPAHDELRLAFHESLEVSRLSILLEDYADAVRHARQAMENSGAAPLKDAHGKDTTKPPIGPLARAEASLFLGAALLGRARVNSLERSVSTAPPLSSEIDQARQFITKALAVPRAMANRMNPEERDRFLRQFITWVELAEQLTAEEEGR